MTIDKETLEEIKRLCSLVCNSDAIDAKSEMASLAFYIGHHPDILNPKSPVEKAKLKRLELNDGQRN